MKKLNRIAMEHEKAKRHAECIARQKKMVIDHHTLELEIERLEKSLSHTNSEEVQQSFAARCRTLPPCTSCMCLG
jgi:hypothetical protein